jgi:hypothetical protein
MRREAERLSMLLTREELQQWYEGMIEEKENRRAYAKKVSAAKAPVATAPVSGNRMKR